MHRCAESLVNLWLRESKKERERERKRSIIDGYREIIRKRESAREGERVSERGERGERERVRFQFEMAYCKARMFILKYS